MIYDLAVRNLPVAPNSRQALRRKPGWSVFVVSGLVWMLTGCSGTSYQRTENLSCTPKLVQSLATYDKYVSQYLDENTRHPVMNLGGQIVWNTRYYLESLLTAYQATGNTKYLRAFEDTGQVVMGLRQTLKFLNVIDPSAPWQTATGPYITKTGWPTYMGAFGPSIPIPTATGAVSLNAQGLYPRLPTMPNLVEITQQPDGSLQFAWTHSGTVLKSYSIQSLSDLEAIEGEKMVFRQSMGRIHVTGAGLPVPGQYSLNPPLLTLWLGEQSGGILLSFARYLVIARDHPEDVDASLAANWRSLVLDLASEYTDHFLDDGGGGFTLHNPIWMAHESADTDAPSDYIYVEVSLRTLLHELTGDQSHLTLARGLMQHQIRHNLPIGSRGWITLRGWPDIYSWSTKAQGPKGSIWDSLTYDNLYPSSTTEGGFFAEMLHVANEFNVASTLGIPTSHYVAHSQTVDQYLRIDDAETRGLFGNMRNGFPRIDSTQDDTVFPTNNPFAGSLFLEDESAQPGDEEHNWQWMQAHSTSPQGWPIGYFLRAWARSEAAINKTCS